MLLKGQRRASRTKHCIWQCGGPGNHAKSNFAGVIVPGGVFVERGLGENGRREIRDSK